MTKREEKRVLVCSVEGYSGMPPDDFRGAMAWFQGHYDSIPEQYRGNATLRIGSESGYEGSHSPSIEIEYWRPETDAEMAARIARTKRESEASQANELKTLAALKAKYESS